MKTPALSLLILLTLTHLCVAEPVQFSSTQHRITATVPDGWDQVQGVTQQTVLKLARLGSGSQKARIALMLHDVPAGSFAPGYDIWNMSDDEIRKSAGNTSQTGETVTVVNAGRGAVDSLHMVWSKTRRTLPDNSTLWEFTYEGVRSSQYLTIRLTSVGDQDWFTTNQAVFAEFIRTVRLSASDNRNTGSISHVKKLAEAYGDANIKGDYEMVADLTYDGIFKAVGGRTEAIKFMKSQMETTKASGITFRAWGQN